MKSPEATLETPISFTISPRECRRLPEDENYKIDPLIALEATLFPGRGIRIGVSNHHYLGDARSMFRFVSANQSGGDEQFLNCSLPPLFDRSVFGDIKGINDNLWSTMRNIALTLSSWLVPTNRFISLLRRHGSTWSVVVKSAAAAGEVADEDATEVLLLPGDGRGLPNALVDPPVPVNYFRNCLGGGAATVEHKKLAAEEGFVAAAEAIADSIKNRVNNKEIFLGDLDSWLSEMSKLARLSTFGVFGSRNSICRMMILDGKGEELGGFVDG
ncbi:hypothetical protein SASPL_114486 [Salvia splendens]|uniref:Shikimate O-hydroxycinnamoyltransferase n=1 Tax=Salvia splendens TaxID=180675 RepID=A0A8X8Y3U2_SALSN|nr:hypothetical protein SASPL_114486 [Salvia splendens]